MNREAMPATSKACASCRHRKERCNGSCEYADLFPACRYDECKNAQRLFGVGNIHNIIRAVVDPKMRKEAAESILTEGNIRRGNPVHGCLGVARSETQVGDRDLQEAAWRREPLPILLSAERPGIEEATTVLWWCFSRTPTVAAVVFLEWGRQWEFLRCDPV